MRSVLVWKGTKPTGSAYCPEPKWSAVDKKANEDNYLQYISEPVKKIVAAAYNVHRGELLEEFEPGCQRLRSVYEQVQVLWESSERRKAQILEQKRQEMAQNDPRLPLGTQHRGNGKKVTLWAVNAQKLIQDMNQIHRVVEQAFSPKVPVAYDQIPRKRQTVEI